MSLRYGCSILATESSKKYEYYIMNIYEFMNIIYEHFSGMDTKCKQSRRKDNCGNSFVKIVYSLIYV